MSDEICTQFEFKSALVLKDTLREMNKNFVETKPNVFVLNRPYHNMVFDANTGRVSLDEENKNEMDLITQNYQTNWYQDCAIREGNTVEKEVLASGEIILHVSR